MLETTQIKQRLPFIDLIRGITIIEMISYHFLWDLVYLYNADIPWYKSHGAYIWQQSICWTFILLAGFSWHLGKKHMKRGLWAFGGGVVVSLVTAIVLPNDRVRYGVLTLIGSCILIRRTGGGSSERFCGVFCRTQPPSAGVQYGAAHGRGNAPSPCRFYPCGNGAVKRTFYKGIYETGIEAAGVCRCRQKADRMGGVDGTGERSSDGDRPAARF